MEVAEKSFTEWVFADRLFRAKNNRSYQVPVFAPGDLVYVWRMQNRKDPKAPSKGGFTGPARVLARLGRMTPETGVQDL